MREDYCKKQFQWRHVKFIRPVAAGHSFGGLTALGAASKESLFVASIAFDPWFYPRSKDYFRVNCPSLMVVNEHFSKDLKKYSPVDYDQDRQVESFLFRNPGS